MPSPEEFAREKIAKRSGYKFAQLGSRASSLTRPTGIMPVQPLLVIYTHAIPIETFDFIVSNECRRSIRQLPLAA
jgi:hypothetical protein